MYLLVPAQHRASMQSERNEWKHLNPQTGYYYQSAKLLENFLQLCCKYTDKEPILPSTSRTLDVPVRTSGTGEHSTSQPHSSTQQAAPPGARPAPQGGLREGYPKAYGVGGFSRQLPDSYGCASPTRLSMKGWESEHGIMRKSEPQSLQGNRSFAFGQPPRRTPLLRLDSRALTWYAGIRCGCSTALLRSLGTESSEEQRAPCSVSSPLQVSEKGQGGC